MRKNKIKKLSLTEETQQINPKPINNFVLLNPTANYILEQAFIFDEIALALCLRGEGHVKINLGDYTITENSILAIPPNNIVEMISKSDDLEIKILFFSFDFMSNFINYNQYEITEKIRRQPCLEISKKDMLDMLDFYLLISKIYHSDEDAHLREDMIKGVLSAYITKFMILYKSVDIGNNATLSYKNNTMTNFLSLVGQHHKQDRTVIFYADKMNMTSRNLSATINKITGRTALIWINDFVITKIKVLLKISDLSATQISEEYNFPTPSLFGRFFKKHTGMTPHEYKNN